MPSLMRRMKTRLSRWVQYQPPADLAANFIALDAAGQTAIVEALKRHYFTRQIWQEATPSVAAWLASPDGQKDLDLHLLARTTTFRHSVIPWLAGARTLRGARVLEIGCGTGTSTVALAEQGAQVTGIDIDEPSLRVARERVQAYGLPVEFLNANAAALGDVLESRRFDIVIFLASLEHMLHRERIMAMRATWDMLVAGGLWCLADTPNRLWYFDAHTASLPFFQWLPDDLAFEYARFSPREPFASSYPTATPEALESFLRHGRGVSYHEFALAFGPAEQLDVVDSLAGFLRRRSRFGVRQLAWRLRRDGRYQRLLAAVGPRLHEGFFEPSLDLIIRKHEAPA